MLIPVRIALTSLRICKKILYVCDGQRVKAKGMH